MDFVIIANAWGAGIDNPTSKHQVARELARQGHRVLWIEGSGMRRPSVGSGADRVRILRKIAAAFQGVTAASSQESGVRSQNGRIWVLAPLFMPFPEKDFVRHFNGWLCIRLARRWCRRLGFVDPVLINYVPVFAEVMASWEKGSAAFAWKLRRARGVSRLRSEAAASQGVQGSVSGGQGAEGEAREKAKSESQVSSFMHHPSLVYHCVDRWDSFKLYNSALMSELDRQCCERADLVIASSQDLYDRCCRVNPNTHLVSHGVDWAHFSAPIRLSGGQSGRPGDMPEGKIVGFFGLISEWIDQELLLKLAREIPAANLLLIGKADVMTETLKGAGNIIQMGPRPYKDLPSYAACFDVGIIPFKVNNLTRAVNPIKLREMLAAGCPVVTTALPEAEKLGNIGSWGGRDNGVAVAGDLGDFIRLVGERLDDALTVAEKRGISNRMQAESWSGKVREIVDLLGR